MLCDKANNSAPPAMSGNNALGPMEPNDDAPFEVKFLKPLEFIKNNNDYLGWICLTIFIHRYILITEPIF